MESYNRNYSKFSLCGLNCGLCPRYQSKGLSKCPGCGGKDFNLKHPTCSVITCNRKHNNVEYCFECKEYPCEKYKKANKKDSFISYLNVKNNFEKCRNLGVDNYKKELDRKISILEYLLENYNNGRLKQFYCNAVNLLELNDLEKILDIVKSNNINTNESIENIVNLIKCKAIENNISLDLRK